MEDTDAFPETERLLLMAAAVLEMGPSTSLSRANTARVVDQALLWLGLSLEEIEHGWQKLAGVEEGEELASPPANEEVYKVLVRMTRPLGSRREAERIGLPLFEGNGNWGVTGDPSRQAAWPHFNSCRLTAHGERVARKLLEQHPQYHKSI